MERMAKLEIALPPGVNFINFLRAAFTHPDLKWISNGSQMDVKWAKITVKISVFFAILQSARVKAALKTLVKSTPVLLLYSLIQFLNCVKAQFTRDTILR